MPIEGPDRRRLAQSLHLLFPHLKEDSAVSGRRGGRTAALAALAQIEPQTYERSRNFLSGRVTHLSAYLRHGVLTLAEVRDVALQRVKQAEQAGKLINELAWRDYWQRLYAELGDLVWQDREPYKTGLPAAQYADALEEEIDAGQTTLACMDRLALDLKEEGYLHNHARLWLASYIVHWRRIRWQAGARWFLQHLLDGDPASNNLSWQWVASTFANAPYIFNRENLERYTDGVYCRTCPHATAGTCPFDKPYERLEAELFPLHTMQQRGDAPATAPKPASPKPASPAHRTTGKALLWHHTDSLNPASPLLALHPAAPAVFVWDTGWLLTDRISFKRVLFLAECLQEMPEPLAVRVGDPAVELLAAASAVQADHLVAQRTADPRLLDAAARVAQRLPVVWFDPPPFVDSQTVFDLKRFSRYWKRAQATAMLPTSVNR